MSPTTSTIIGIGNDIISYKYYGVAAYTIYFYDYLLTLPDEIKYAWHGRKSWAFWLFLVNRYLPMTVAIWQTGLIDSPQSRLNATICDRTAWYPAFALVVSTLLAQVVVTARIYAVTMRSVSVTIGFVIISVFQLGFGICMVAFAARGEAQQFPLIPIDAFRLCSHARHKSLEVAYISFSLFCDFFAFSLITFLSKRSKTEGHEIPILRCVAEDATRYFLVIFTSHLVLVMTLNLGREMVQLLPACGNVVYLPAMVSRLMLSLKKAANPQRDDWSLGEPPANGSNFQSIKFFRPPVVTTFGSDTPLGTDCESWVEA